MAISKRVVLQFAILFLIVIFVQLLASIHGTNNFSTIGSTVRTGGEINLNVSNAPAANSTSSNWLSGIFTVPTGNAIKDQSLNSADFSALYKVAIILLVLAIVIMLFSILRNPRRQLLSRISHANSFLEEHHYVKAYELFSKKIRPVFTRLEKTLNPKHPLDKQIQAEYKKLKLRFKKL